MLKSVMLIKAGCTVCVSVSVLGVVLARVAFCDRCAPVLCECACLRGILNAENHNLTVGLKTAL